MTAACNSMEKYITKVHGEEIARILTSTKQTRRTIQINLTHLKEWDEKFFKSFCTNYDIENEKWKKALKNVTEEVIVQEGLEIKNEDSNLDIEYFQHPEACWPKIEKNHLWKVVEFRAYVFRSSSATKMEHMREIYCKTCKKKKILKGDRTFNYSFPALKKCTLTPLCRGNLAFSKDEEKIPFEYTIDFQEFKVQEVAKTTPKNEFLIVQAENKLINSCDIGDTVRVLGIFEYRVGEFDLAIKKFVVRAISIRKESLAIKLILEPEQISNLINAWNEDLSRHSNNEIQARDEMLLSFAPDLIGCYGLKLALMMVLCSGDAKAERSNPSNKFEIKDREVCHLLLAGVPGIGKSQLMKAVMKVSARAIKTVGMESTKAGLTASYYKEKGVSHIEAGALVLANNGICCIDEFNLMPVAVKEALHEVMEQQKFILCRGSLKQEIYAKCSIIASMNHKLKFIPKDCRTDSENELRELNMQASLASRFDLIFLLENPGADHNLQLVDHILENILKSREEIVQEKTKVWNLKRLQLHVICAKGIEVEITEEVHTIIIRYFDFCQACEGINLSRNTIRLKNSLQRLTIAHAKMLLRKRTKIIDVMTAIWLIENSWTFGNLIEPINMIRSELPVGPSTACIEYVLDALGLEMLIETFRREEELNSKNPPNKISSNNLYGNEETARETSSIESMAEKTEVPENLQKAFAISSIDDLFEDEGENENTSKEEAFNSFPSFCSFMQPIATTSTQAEELPQEEQFKKPPPAKQLKSLPAKPIESPPAKLLPSPLAKRSTSPSKSDNEAAKKQKVSGSSLEESLGMLNSLMGMNDNEETVSNKTIAEKFANSIGSNGITQETKKTTNLFDKAKTKNTSVTDRLKRFNYESQGDKNIQELKTIEPEKLLFQECDLDAENFNPYD